MYSFLNEIDEITIDKFKKFTSEINVKEYNLKAKLLGLNNGFKLDNIYYQRYKFKFRIDKTEEFKDFKNSSEEVYEVVDMLELCKEYKVLIDEDTVNLLSFLMFSKIKGGSILYTLAEVDRIASEHGIIVEQLLRFDFSKQKLYINLLLDEKAIKTLNPTIEYKRFRYFYEIELETIYDILTNYADVNNIIKQKSSRKRYMVYTDGSLLYYSSFDRLRNDNEVARLHIEKSNNNNGKIVTITELKELNMIEKFDYKKYTEFDNESWEVQYKEKCDSTFNSNSRTIVTDIDTLLRKIRTCQITVSNSLCLERVLKKSLPAAIAIDIGDMERKAAIKDELLQRAYNAGKKVEAVSTSETGRFFMYIDDKWYNSTSLKGILQ